ncbi:MAG: glycosyltransferase family 39 protein [Anaerolineales bacterium]|nr:glycosyltransferase family 39 protein [Anaerolineales bacterium]
MAALVAVAAGRDEHMTQTARPRPLLAASILVWFAVALAYYYAFHRPFTPQFAIQAVLAGRDVLCTALLFALGGALGTRLLPAGSLPALARLALRAAVGLGLLGLLYLLVGSTLGTSAGLAWLLALGLLLLLRGELRQWARDFSGLAELWQHSGRLGRALAILSGVIFAFGMLSVLTPPLAFDTLVYHLSLPKIYLAQGRVGYVPEITHWGFPQGVHMLVTWAGALGSAHGALVSWGMGALAVLGVLGHVTQRISARAGWVAVTALLSGSSLVNALSSGYVDWPGVLMGWGVLLLLEQWLLTRQPRWAMWAGVLCGLAFGAKYTSGLLAPLGVLVFLLASKPDIRAALRYLAAAFVLALPWLLRNFIYTGNPFYPLLLPGGEMDAIRLSFYQGLPAQANWLDAVFLPFRATWLGIEGGHIGTAPGYETSLGPLLLLFAMLAWVPSATATPPLRRVAGVLSVGGLLIWAAGGLLTGHLIRSHLYYSLFPAFAILAAFGFAAVQNLRLGTVRVGRVAAAVVALSLALSALQAGLALPERGVPQLWSGELDVQAYSERNLGLYALVMRELPADGRTLMLWEARGHACAPRCDPDEVIDRWQHDLARYGSPQAAVQSWQAAGYDYVLYSRLAAQFVHADPQHFHVFDLQSVEDALAQLSVLQDFNGDYVLYALQP